MCKRGYMRGVWPDADYERRCLARCDSDALWKYTLQSVLDDCDDQSGIILDAIGSDEHSYLCRKCINAYHRVCRSYKPI